MTKFVILSQTLSFIAIERSKSDIILCQIMTKFVVFLTLKGLNDKVGPRDETGLLVDQHRNPSFAIYSNIQ